MKFVSGFGSDSQIDQTVASHEDYEAKLAIRELELQADALSGQLAFGIVASSEQLQAIGYDGSNEGFVGDIWKKIKELWKKFKDWVKGLFGKDKEKKEGTEEKLKNVVESIKGLTDEQAKKVNGKKVKLSPLNSSNKFTKSYFEHLASYQEVVKGLDVAKLVKDITDAASNNIKEKNYSFDSITAITDKIDFTKLGVVEGQKGVLIIDNGKVKLLGGGDGMIRTLAKEAKEMEIDGFDKDGWSKVIGALTATLSATKPSANKDKALDEFDKAISEAEKADDAKAKGYINVVKTLISELVLLEQKAWGVYNHTAAELEKAINEAKK